MYKIETSGKEYRAVNELNVKKKLHRTVLKQIEQNFSILWVMGF